MPESPDFESIARGMFPVDDTGQDAVGAEMSAASRDHLIALLRQVWNARGAADVAVCQADDANHLAEQIRTLDR